MTVQRVKTIEPSDEVIEVTEAEFDEMNKSPKVSDFTIKDPKAKSEAKRLYMDHKTYNYITTTLNIPPGTLQAWVYKYGWSQERKDNDAANLGETTASKQFKMDRLVDATLDAMLKTVEKVAKDGCQIKDLGALTAMAGQIEKLARLTKGQATSISEERSKRATVNFTPLTTKQIPMQDPFKVESDNDSNGVPDGSTPS